MNTEALRGLVVKWRTEVSDRDAPAHMSKEDWYDGAMLKCADELAALLTTPTASDCLAAEDGDIAGYFILNDGRHEEVVEDLRHTCASFPLYRSPQLAAGFVVVPREALNTEAKRLRYRASETWGLGQAFTDAGAQMIATAGELERLAAAEDRRHD